MSRRLRPDETALWDQIKRSVTPMERPKTAPRPISNMPDRVAEAPAPPAVASVGRLQPFTIGSKPAAKSTAAVPKSAPAMDAKAFGRMVRGKLKPEGRIDLHGMVLEDAKPALVHFILGSHARGRRLVLVITGKGEGKGPTGPLPYQRGILRRQVPAWLQQAPLNGLVLETSPAHRAHGGDGALYVYLRRPKAARQR